ncbi:MAG: AAA family ATPase [Gammaproteobacteria bacterium]|nr:AAA family ATPase [Gammaproteobacteria bacterium]
MNALTLDSDTRAGVNELHKAIESVNSIILGKQQEVKLAMSCVLAGGHLLIEDIPGVGKTTLAHAMARALGLDFQRIQFTSDLLPADILGAAIFRRETGNFDFQAGPIFSQMILADEVNRATPKTQSALLEAMEERQVTAEGVTRPLPSPFFVIATQNPQTQIGTFPLPESQLDRFLLRITMGYPAEAAERELLEGRDRRDMVRDIEPVMDGERLLKLQAKLDSVVTAGPLLDYIQALVRYSRELPDLVSGLSPRAALALRRAAQAWAMLDGRTAVIPEDVQAVFAGVVNHRLRERDAEPGRRRESMAQEILEAVAIP